MQCSVCEAPVTADATACATCGEPVDPGATRTFSPSDLAAAGAAAHEEQPSPDRTLSQPTVQHDAAEAWGAEPDPWGGGPTNQDGWGATTGDTGGWGGTAADSAWAGTPSAVPADPASGWTEVPGFAPAADGGDGGGGFLAQLPTLAVLGGIVGLVGLLVIGFLVLRPRGGGSAPGLPIAVREQPSDAYTIDLGGQPTQAVRDGDLLVVASEADDDIRITAVDAGTGDERWDVRVGEGFDPQVLIDDVVIVTYSTFDADEEVTIHGLDRGTGDELWDDQLDAPTRLDRVGDRSFVIADGEWLRLTASTGDTDRIARGDHALSGDRSVLVEVDDTDIEVRNLDGERIADFEVDDLEDVSFPAVEATASRVYVAIDDELFAYDTRGEELWAEDLESGGAFLTLLPDGNLLVRTDEGSELWTPDGEQLWDDRERIFALGGQAGIGLFFDDPDIEFVDLATGGGVSTIDDAEELGFRLADGVIYVFNDDGDELTAVDYLTEAELWAVDLEADGDFSDMFVVDGMILVQSDRDELTAYR